MGSTRNIKRFALCLLVAFISVGCTKKNNEGYFRNISTKAPPIVSFSKCKMKKEMEKYFAFYPKQDIEDAIADPRWKVAGLIDTPPKNLDEAFYEILQLYPENARLMNACCEYKGFYVFSIKDTRLTQTSGENDDLYFWMYVIKKGRRLIMDVHHM